ncbi:hypothetical protein SK571_04115 [Lentzea sp. BCCO 10_0798]|uniref:ABC-2 type transport system ATP-binding protein n=1 Tax=Lentzea kristufekii TaxID=3095430 RepID=A0ABU4TKE7_9PSEU|nr:hypothetical protein [Lentzea sp. BCCO 10_0798]MDX8048553.1 hypothetical protein [Lentzea sp. BCCO 10_0798]
MPKVLLLDEPPSDLDPLAQDEALRGPMTEAAEHGTTVLMSSHLLGDLSDLCDHLPFLGRSRIQLAGGVDVLTEHPLFAVPAAETPEVHSWSSPALTSNGRPGLEWSVKGRLRAAR